ncbi:putative metalloprotease CJM1_0395 family protein [Shewanella aestuarii]|uniref:Catalase n=1 Tax=Shewanella aestuarii TaxID=1028752 RepID=A0A6G9QJL8_9GAMM|nr:putative metalloprotease CJM1_0395 family protein [Shewanella aestuarii]QIR14750.1 hypothetical protein HBH39_09825 [Shewanella aestuarii]
MDIRQQSSVITQHFAASTTKAQQVSPSASSISSVVPNNLSYLQTKPSSPSVSKPIVDTNRQLDIDVHESSQYSHSSVELQQTSAVKRSPILSSSTPISSLAKSSANHQFSLKTGPMSIAAINPAQISESNNINSQDVNSLGDAPVDVFTEQNPTSPINPFEAQQEQQAKPLFDADGETPFGNREEGQQSPQQVNASNAEQQETSHENQDEDKQASKIEQVEKAIEKQQQKIELAEQQQIDELAKRDAEVKTHEQAHKAVGGMFAQSPSYSYEKGPDGKRYAVDGEVQIDVSVVNGDPQATFNKMQKVYAAAMAPVQPSAADIRVAAEAIQKMNQAKAEMAQQRQEKITPAEDIQHINELANTYKQTIEQSQGFEQSQLAPFSQEESPTSDPQSRFIDKLNQQIDTQNPQVPNATLAYLNNQFNSQTSEINSQQPKQTFEFTV